MYPDTGWRGREPETEALGEMSPVTAVAHPAQQQQRAHQRAQQVQQQSVEEPHARAASSARHRQRLIARALAVTIEQAMPVRLAEALRGQVVGYLLERAPQAYEVAVTPQARAAQLTLIEVDQVHPGILAEQHVVRVEIGTTHAKIVETTDTASDADPGQDRECGGRQALGERAHRVEPLGDDITAVGESPALVARRE